MAATHPFPTIPEEHHAQLTYDGRTYAGIGKLQLKGRDHDGSLIHTGEFTTTFDEMGVTSEQEAKEKLHFLELATFEGSFEGERVRATVRLGHAYAKNRYARTHVTVDLEMMGAREPLEK